MTDVLGIGQPVHAYGQVEGGERDVQVVQGGAAAQQEVAPVRVGRGEVAVPVGVQLDAALGDLPPEPVGGRSWIIVRIDGSDGIVTAAVARALARTGCVRPRRRPTPQDVVGPVRRVGRRRSP